MPLQSLMYSKELVRGRYRQLLHEVNEIEAVKLEELIAAREKKYSDSPK